jgi:acyl-CoA thioester hydrolase
VTVSDRKPPFRFSHMTRVGFDETDAQGVVYYGRYLPYFDRARVEYLRHLGLLHSGPADREFVMRANRVEYHAPARFDDLLEVFVRAERIGTSSVVFQFAACDDHGADLCTAEQVVVLIDRTTRRPVTVGEAYRNAVDLFEGRAPAVAAVPDDTPAGRRSGAVDAVERIVNSEGEADEILRQAVATIAKRFDTFCGIRFVEDGGMLDGPSAGAFGEPRAVVPITYDDSSVAEIVLGNELADEDRDALDRIAELLSAYCLVGWDTGGESWNP